MIKLVAFKKLTSSRNSKDTVFTVNILFLFITVILFCFIRRFSV